MYLIVHIVGTMAPLSRSCTFSLHLLFLFQRTCSSLYSWHCNDGFMEQHHAQAPGIISDIGRGGGGGRHIHERSCLVLKSEVLTDRPVHKMPVKCQNSCSKYRQKLPKSCSFLLKVAQFCKCC